MALDEFSLIRQYFHDQMPSGVLGAGDDAAMLPMPAGSQLVVCKDLMIEGRHFLPDVSPVTLGHKCLAVNLSDLAAMGATPIGCLLGIGLRQAEPKWLESFSSGLRSLARHSGCPLVGGDTVRVQGETVISVTALGYLPQGESGLLRAGAQTGDDIWVSGFLGAPSIALLGMRSDPRVSAQHLARTRQALEMPQPRLALGQGLLGLSRCAIDISDGLLQDLEHILTASECGATIEAQALPLDPALEGLAADLCLDAALSGGDVYELCFTAPTANRQPIEALGERLGLTLTRIGTIYDGRGVRVLGRDASVLSVVKKGFDHFKDED